MNIEIDDKYDRKFVEYLKYYIYDIIKRDINILRCENFKREFNLNVKDVVLFAIKSMTVSHVKNKFILSINKNIFYKDKNIEKLINLITYGSRSVKGYRIVPQTFDLVSNNIDDIYGRWLSNGY